MPPVFSLLVRTPWWERRTGRVHDSERRCEAIVEDGRLVIRDPNPAVNAQRRPYLVSLDVDELRELLDEQA